MPAYILLFCLLCIPPAFAAEAPATNTDSAPAKEEPAKIAKSEPDSQPASNATSQAHPAEYTCKYYSVKMPEGWQAIVPPEDQMGNINAIFATNTGGTILTMVAGPSSGEDAQAIANMFAEQFKAKDTPVLKNGLYTFKFPVQNAMATAWVASYDGNFMMTYIVGSIKEAQKFIRENITSESWPGLLPK